MVWAFLFLIAVVLVVMVIPLAVMHHRHGRATGPTDEPVTRGAEPFPMSASGLRDEPKRRGSIHGW